MVLPGREPDSIGCFYDGNLELVDTHYFISNITVQVTDDDDDANGTCGLEGTYTGLATFEEEYEIIDHPHTHYKFMTFGVSDGSKTINNRMTFIFTGLQ